MRRHHVRQPPVSSAMLKQVSAPLQLSQICVPFVMAPQRTAVACTCGSVECTSDTGLICYSTYGGGSCRKTGFGPFGYTKEAGDTNCESVSNRKPILDKAACEAAATSMGLDDVEAYEESVSFNPPGCRFSCYDSRLLPDLQHAAPLPLEQCHCFNSASACASQHPTAHTPTE